MISIEQLDGEISVLESEKPTYTSMQKLASLYTVRDHILLDKPTVTTVHVTSIPQIASESDFAQAIVGKDIGQILNVVDQLVSTVQVTDPALYNNFMRELP